MAVYFKEGFAPVVGDLTTSGLVKQLALDILASTNAKWSLHFPETSAEIKNVFTLKHTLTTGGVTPTTKDVLVEFYMPKFIQQPDAGKLNLVDTADPNYYYLEVVYGTGTYTDPVVSNDQNYLDPGVWEVDKASLRSRFSWFKSDTESTIKSWLPVQYWISLTDTRLSLILAGDASANKNDRLISFGYFGEVKPFEGSLGSPLANFAVTTGSDVPPGEYLLLEEMTRYSDKTGTGVTDINMLQTYTGFPMQSHYPAFTTPDELIDKKLEGPSQYTGKYHMSPVYVFHGFDGYRGQLDGIIATDRSTVVNLDDLIHKYNSETGSEVSPDTEDTYKTFMVNAPFSLLNNATNVLYGLAMLKATAPIV